jgi:hypothetical protein
VASAAGEDGGPEGLVGGLLAGTEEEDAVGAEQAMDAGAAEDEKDLSKIEYLLVEAGGGSLPAAWRTSGGSMP